MSAAAATPAPPRLPGDRFIWYVIMLEGTTFGVLFIAFAFTRLWHLELFRASQQKLDISAGAINTGLLLTASWCIARAVQGVRAGGRGAGLGWLGAGIAGGVGFVALKLTEYAAKAAQGIGLSTNLFFDFYFILTGFHLLHVLAGLFALSLSGVGLMRQPREALSAYTLETFASFWHLVDLLWLVLFPLVYVMR
ncbi:MAG: cytochrome c oxidase subunit 3 [Desulfovibrionaceae bacterium]|jgi:nitric oxide reductase NorE protein|nr:cytochrome c oxidase subunit 3 [Desulfovibrionaceae bacterium]